RVGYRARALPERQVPAHVLRLFVARRSVPCLRKHARRQGEEPAQGLGQPQGDRAAAEGGRGGRAREAPEDLRRDARDDAGGRPARRALQSGRRERRQQEARGLRGLVPEPRAPVGREGGPAMNATMRLAAFLLLAFASHFAQAAGPLDRGPMTLTLQYHTAPGDRIALKEYMQVTGLEQWAGWRDQGIVKDYR